jgi:hypothetical protein
MLMLAGATIASREVYAGSFVYNVVNYPALQNGYTVTGTITTSVNQGTDLPTTDITSWDVTITGSAGTFEFTPIDSSALGHLDVTPTTITVATAGDVLEFVISTAPYIFWSGPQFPEYAADGPGGQPLWTTGLFNPTTDPVAAVPSTVPEPSAGVLAVLGAVTGLAYGWARKCRSQRRHNDAGQPQPRRKAGQVRIDKMGSFALWFGDGTNSAGRSWWNGFSRFKSRRGANAVVRESGRLPSIRAGFAGYS